MNRLNIEFRAGRAAKTLDLYAVDEKFVSESARGGGRHQGRRVRDYWLDVSGVTKRVHLRPRRALCTPVDVDAAGCPRARFATGVVRITEGIFEDGTAFKHCDDWTVLAVAHRPLQMKWTGTTTFVDKCIRAGL